MTFTGLPPTIDRCATSGHDSEAPLGRTERGFLIRKRPPIADGPFVVKNIHKSHNAITLFGRSLNTLNMSWLFGKTMTHAVRKMSMKSVNKPMCR